VRLQDGVARLGLTTSDELTLCGWFRTTAAPGAGGDMVNVGDSFLLRIKPTQIEQAKRVSNDPGSSYVVALFLGSGAYLDGRWHHVAGVLGRTGLTLYVDGVARVMDPTARPLIYVARDLWVGRRELGATNNFQGGIDDVRVYRRALAAQEIQEIALGR
jgi:sialidase-1